MLGDKKDPGKKTPGLFYTKMAKVKFFMLYKRPFQQYKRRLYTRTSPDGQH